MKLSHAGVLGAAVLVIGLGTTASSAQTAEQTAGARAAATQGAAAFQKGQWQEAIDLFSRAESLVHAPPHLLYMARASVKLGKLVKAQELYLKIVRDKLAPGAPAAFREAQQSAEAEVKDVEAKIAHLTIQVTGAGGAAVAVTVDGEKVPPALVGIAMPVDPGTRQLQATAPGFAAVTQSVTLAAGASQSVSLVLTADAAAPAGSASVPPAAGGAPAAPPGSAPPTPPDRGSGAESSGNGLRIGSYVALGVGVVGLGAGTLFALQSSSKRSDADAAFEACGSPCLKSNPHAADAAGFDDSAKSAQTLATVGFIVGGVGIATGVTLFLLSSGKHDEKAAHAPRIQPWVGLQSAGVTGTF
ncbi:MAG: hypothetical protein OZ921_02085 [Sorangiineae bacterium]|nr:hypothetical protein [Polyangiaceae bacterium]MEB2321274.1 hypothetical protein [Sorangiineae bacterium]